MKHLGRPVTALGWTLALAACAQGGGGVAQAPPPAGGAELADVAVLLARSEEAPGPAERAPLVRRLQRLNVAAAEGTPPGEDVLAHWQVEAASGAGAEPPLRGRTLGPAYRRASIDPGESLEMQQIFYAGQRAEIAGQTVGGQPVELEIRNQQDKPQLVCSAKLQPAGTCRWLPLFTGRFSMKLVNRGSKPVSVYLVFR